MPRAPRGLKAMENPLKHKFRYSFALNANADNSNTVLLPLVKNYKSVTDPATAIVNPHNTSIDLETGAICAPMSIIENLTLSMHFNALTTQAADEMKNVRFWWMPIFGSFAEKYDADDDGGGGTVAAMLQLTKDATEEDITALTTNKLRAVGTSDLLHAVSTVNFAEVFGTLNMTTDITMEDCPFDATAFFNLLQYGTNKGALKACIGKIRHGSVGYSGDARSIVKSYFIKKFVPRAVRRIVPYSFFGIMIHVPLISEIGQNYTEDTSLNTTLNHIGVKVHVNYDEWNEEHDNSHA